MYVTLLLMLAAASSLDAVDDANLALTTCGFAAYREADGQNQSLDQFERTLASRCANQMATMRELTVQFQIGRKGLSRSAAESAADGLLSGFRTQFADQYSRRAETKAQMEALERALREEK